MIPESPRPVIHVVAGVVIDAEGCVLIAQRPAGKHLAGGWEFPGGKLEPGEERLAGLARELREELGIVIGPARPLIRVRHAYPSREVLLDVWVVRSYSGEPKGLDGQALRWCAQDELGTAEELLPADKPIVAALRLPERLMEIATPYYSVSDLISLEPPTVGAEFANDTRLRGVFCTSAEARIAMKAGADFLVLRDALADQELTELCDSIPIPVFARGIGLEQAWALGGSGLNEICL